AIFIRLALSLRGALPISAMQDPSGRQQAPSGLGQCAEPHSTPSPWYTPSSLSHCASVRVSQVPSGKQQAPVAGHSAVSQVTSTPDRNSTRLNSSHVKSSY